jgi:outer membrane protein OmpA-like peptidoglycan-associated protein
METRPMQATRLHTAGLALAGLLAAASTGAQAQTASISGVYIGAAAGGNLRYLAENTTGTSPHDRANMRPGLVGLGAIGYAFGDAGRVELEGSYRGNRVDNTKGSTLGNWRHLHGDARTYGGMVNYTRDIHSIQDWLGIDILPYWGFGLGWAASDWGSITSETTGTSHLTFRRRIGGAPAGQLILGLGYELAPGLSLNVEGRAFGQITDTDKVRTVLHTSSTTATQGQIKPHNVNASVLVGLRYAFNTAPAAPATPMPVPVPVQAAPAPFQVPAPAPVPARTYIVYFAYNNAALDARARDIVTEAVRAIRSNGVTRVELAGHTDAAGTDRYNQRLSMRRAEVVAAEMGRQGVRRDQIAVTAFGKTQPLVPNPANGREPQNRRVEIVLR